MYVIVGHPVTGNNNNNLFPLIHMCVQTKMSPKPDCTFKEIIDFFLTMGYDFCISCVYVCVTHFCRKLIVSGTLFIQSPSSHSSIIVH